MKLLRLISVFTIALLLVQGCDPTSRELESGDKNASALEAELNNIKISKNIVGKPLTLEIDLNSIKVMKDDEEVIVDRKFDVPHNTIPSDVLSFLKSFRNEIVAIRLGKYFNASKEGEIRNFFSLVRELPTLQSFSASLLGSVSEPLIWQGILSLPKLKDLSIPWENEAIAQLALKHPQIEEITFPVLTQGEVNDQAIETLSSLKNLKKIALVLDDDKADAIVRLMQHANRGFLKLETLQFQYHNAHAMDALAKNFQHFKSLTELSFAGIESKSLINFLKTTPAISTKLSSLSVAPLMEFRKLEDRVSFLEVLPSLNLKSLELQWFDLEEQTYKLLEKLRSLEKLNIEIPASKNIDTIKNLLAKMPKLKVLELKKLRGGMINGNKIPAQFLSTHELDVLQKQFPLVKITADKELNLSS